MTKQKPVLMLKQFMLRQEVLTLYRTIFRTIRQVPDEKSQLELKDWARREFRENAHHTEELSIKMMLNYGKRCLSELQTSLSLAKS